ncbi:glycosyltransferase [Sphingobacterium chuzhouense]|uniref:Glycosyltransferase n=2 Tax=Sphingobacterium chuzhouense TaxID=1742264 RepID=A0ABR7XM54_9SPHI|nr:glycosyltransferase [Sphingobacterium chuzhouense]
MAAYNAAPFISQAIESVLNQTFEDFELLIVNDGSTDNTREIVHSFTDPRIRLIENDGNKGLSFTRNVALTEAKGEFMAILDSDDIAHPDRLEIQIQHFLNRPKLAVLGGYAYIIDHTGCRTGQEMAPICETNTLHAGLLFYNSFVHSTVMLRMSAFTEVGGYPPYIAAEDYGLFSRIALKHEVSNIPQYLIEYRIHGNNISLQKKDIMEAQLKDILFYQLDKLSLSITNLDPAILLSPVTGSKYSPKEYYTLYRSIIFENRKHKQYPTIELERIFFNNWYAIIMEKGKSNTFPLFLRKPIFNQQYVTAKQIRKTFKQSLKYLLGIQRS